MFCAFRVPFLHSPRSVYFQAAVNLDGFYRILRALANVKMKAKKRKSVAKTQKGAQILQGSLTRVISRCAKLFLVGSIKIVMHTYLYYGAVSHRTSYSSASFGIRQTHLYIIGKSTFTIRSVVLSFITNISMYMGRYFILPTTLRLAAEKT